MVHISRRSALSGAAAVAATGALAGCAQSFSSPQAGEEKDVFVDFYGSTQTGIEQTKPQFGVFAAFDLPAITIPKAQGLLRSWTHDAALLLSGNGGLADLEPELAVGGSALTITIGLGSTFFTKLGLEDKQPPEFGPLPAFEQIDKLQDQWSGGDMLLQICGNNQMAAAHALRVLSSSVRNVAKVRWVQRGFHTVSPQDPSQTGRNLFGQVDETSNPRGNEISDVVFAPASAGLHQHSTTMVIRRIEMDVDGWEEIDRESRELFVGRTLDNGAPLTGTSEHDAPDFDAVNDRGLPVIPKSSHIARAVSQNPHERIFRRGFNYDDAPLPGKISNSGLIFVSYQRNINAQFVPIQRRLAEKDGLNRWTTPIGSAVFYIPPGITDVQDYIGSRLFA